MKSNQPKFSRAERTRRAAEKAHRRSDQKAFCDLRDRRIRDLRKKEDLLAGDEQTLVRLKRHLLHTLGVGRHSSIYCKGKRTVRGIRLGEGVVLR